ncbi:hypothetical protein SUGI_0300870 [Cryptomeria japonica]|uniref:antifungal protein ginkbilobin-like protein n=1 Tax=Cryptomeria japonica TaxID=3369 RepID=UPI002408DF49|nr:antifungal protein ginkbilobin-like protein [Cryptomeria japonica]GLJ17327.1 hypothetical protein SUGI_0300870 [Cryptomeria japonica]
MRKPACQPILIVILIVGFAFHAIGVPNTKVVQTLCNGNTYSQDDPFKKSVDYVEEDLVEQTASDSNKCDYLNISPFPISFAYGHATCNATLSVQDRGECLKAARQSVQNTCGSAVGARVRLVDCSLRYEAYPFSD